MEAPVIVDDSGDVVMFGSVDDAERYIEIYDVRDGSIRAFDAAGRVLNLSITAAIPPRVRVSEAGDEAPDACGRCSLRTSPRSVPRSTWT